MLEATGTPSGASAAVISLLVVVLPLVPVTSTHWRPAASWDSRPGASRRLMLPPMTEPSPRPARREAAAADLPAVVAIRARKGSRGRRRVFSFIVGEPILIAAASGPPPAGGL